MAFGLAFWIVMLLWLVLAFPWPAAPWPSWAPTVLLFLLFLLLGWRVFGPPLQG